jgi:hypothetical protein
MAKARAMATRCFWPPESLRIHVGAVCQAHLLQQFHRLRAGLCLGRAQHGDHAFHHVLQRRHVREQVEVLEHHAGAGAEGGQFTILGQARLAAVNSKWRSPMRTALVGHGQQVQAAQQGGLAGAGWPDQATTLPGPIDGDVLEHYVLAEGLLDC